ncbi:MAG: hypothetical protein ACE5EK_01745 [Nitrospinales bacterium]
MKTLESKIKKLEKGGRFEGADGKIKTMDELALESGYRPTVVWEEDLSHLRAFHRTGYGRHCYDVVERGSDKDKALFDFEFFLGNGFLPKDEKAFYAEVESWDLGDKTEAALRERVAFLKLVEKGEVRLLEPFKVRTRLRDLADKLDPSLRKYPPINGVEWIARQFGYKLTQEWDGGKKGPRKWFTKFWKRPYEMSTQEAVTAFENAMESLGFIGEFAPPTQDHESRISALEERKD